MKLTKTYLKQIIKEELNYLLENEENQISIEAQRVLDKLKNIKIGLWTSVFNFLKNDEDMQNPITRNDVLHHENEIINIYKEKMQQNPNADQEYINSSSEVLRSKIRDLYGANKGNYMLASGRM